MNPKTTVNLELSDEDSKCIDPENVRQLFKAMVQEVLGTRTLTEFKDGEVDIKVNREPESSIFGEKNLVN